MSSEDQIDKLEALLQRVRHNASSPRVSIAILNGNDAHHALEAASEEDATEPPDSPRSISRATIQLASSIPPPLLADVADENDVEDDEDDDEDGGQSTAVRRFDPEPFDLGPEHAAAEPPISRSPSSLPSVPPAQVHSRPSPLMQAVVDHAEAQSLDGPDSNFNLMPPPPRLPPISLPSANPEVFGAQARIASDADDDDRGGDDHDVHESDPPQRLSSRPPPPLGSAPVATSPYASSVTPSPLASSVPPPARVDRASVLELEDLEGSLRPPMSPSEPPATTNEPAALALSAPEEVVDVDDDAELYDDEPGELVMPSRMVDDDAAGVAVTRVPPPRSLLSFEESRPSEVDEEGAPSDVRDVSTKPPPSQNETVDVADVDAIERELLASRPIDLEQIETPIPSDRVVASTGYTFEDEETNAFGAREDEADRAGGEPRTLPPSPGVDTDEHAPASARKPRETGRPLEEPLPGFEELGEPPPESGEVPSEAAARLAERRDAEVHADARDDVASDRPTPRPSPPPYDDPMAERTAEVTAMGRVDIVDRSTLSQDIVVAMVSGGFRTASETFGEVLAEALSFGE